jgi:hypothetical protein
MLFWNWPIFTLLAVTLSARKNGFLLTLSQLKNGYAMVLRYAITGGLLICIVARGNVVHIT